MYFFRNQWKNEEFAKYLKVPIECNVGIQPYNLANILPEVIVVYVVLLYYSVSLFAYFIVAIYFQQWSYCFLLVEKANTTAYTFFAKTEEMKRKWIEAINMAL